MSSKDDESKEILPKKSPSHTRIMKRRNSLESGGESGGSGSKNCGGSGSSGGDSHDCRDFDISCLRRHKSLDGGDDSNFQKNGADDKDKDKKDPRTERRIRNKVLIRTLVKNEKVI